MFGYNKIIKKSERVFGGMKMKKIRIVNKKRFMLSMIMLTILLFFMASSVFAAINKVEGYDEPKYIEVVVKGGDTIWNLAREFSPNNKDIRKSIYEIGIVNNLDSYDIFPGQVIKIPKE